MIVRKDIDFSTLPPLSDEEIKELKRAADDPIDFSDIPEFTEEELKQFKLASQINHEERRKERLEKRKLTVAIRFSPEVLKKAKSLGEGYTTVLARVLECALSDNNILKKYLLLEGS